MTPTNVDINFPTVENCKGPEDASPARNAESLIGFIHKLLQPEFVERLSVVREALESLNKEQHSAVEILFKQIFKDDNRYAHLMNMLFGPSAESFTTPKHGSGTRPQVARAAWSPPPYTPANSDDEE